MNRYHKCAHIVVCLSAVLLCAGCGGGVHLGGLLSTGTTHARVVADGLRVHPEIAYSLKGFPSAEGLTLVPLVDEYTPDRGSSAIHIAVHPDDADGRIVSLTATGARQLLAHLHYDPEKWRIAGVGSLNAWQAVRDFRPLAVIVQPGVLLLYNMPVGDSAAGATAHGEFARVFLEPASSRTASYSPPNGKGSLGVIWSNDPSRTPAIKYGVIHYNLDGAVGDLSTKDGDITGSELGHDGEVADNVLHPCLFAECGKAKVKGDGWRSPVLAFRENLTGDYDNNGEVNLGDITETSAFANNIADDYTYNAMRGAHENGSTDWFSVKQLMSDALPAHHWNEYSGDLNVFWYLMQPGWTNPTNYTYSINNQPGHPSTENANSIDGNWDGYVGEFKNWNSDQLPGPDGFYDEPRIGNVPGNYHPGDVGPISEHFSEHITGYRVYTIYHGAEGYNASDPPPPTPLASAVCAENFYAPNRWPGGYPQITPAPVPYTKPYYDSNWSGYNADHRYWKSEIDLTFQPDDFTGMDGSEDRTYDFLIYPYFWDGLDIHYGPVSRISNAYAYFTEDGYGPQYTTNHANRKLAAPDDSSLGDGLYEVDEVSFDDYQLAFWYYNADDVVPAGLNGGHRWAVGTGTTGVKYQLYCSMSSDPVALFTANNLLHHLTSDRFTDQDYWRNGDDIVQKDQLNIDTQKRLMPLALSATELAAHNVTWAKDATIYFGIRAAEDGGAGLPEYAAPGGGWDPNYSHARVTLQGLHSFGPQYKGPETPYDGDPPPPAPPDTAKGIVSIQQFGTATSLQVQYHNADQVDGDENNVPHWGSPIVRYTLYVADSSGNVFTAPFATTSWMEDPGHTELILTHTVTGTELPLQIPKTWYFGIRAQDPDTNLPEYKPWSLANNQFRQLDMKDDIQKPHFITESAPYDSTSTTHEPNSLLYGGNQIIPMTNGAIVYFRRAIDPPEFSTSENIFYLCYWSETSFTWDHLDSIMNVSKHLKYSDNWDSVFKTFNYENYSFYINGLIPGHLYHIYVCARDDALGANGLPAPNQSDNTVVWPYRFPALPNGGQSLVGGSVSRFESHVVGDMVADRTKVSVIYGHGTCPVPGWDGAFKLVGLEFRECDGGSGMLGLPESVFNFPLAYPSIPPVPCCTNNSSAVGGTTQTGLDFERDANGQPVLVNGYRVPLVAYIGMEDVVITHLVEYLMTTFRSGDVWDSGNIAQHRQPADEDTARSTTVFSFTASPALHTYTYRDSLTGLTTSLDFLPWGTYWFNTVFGSGDELRYKTGHVDQGWPGQLHSYITLDSIGPYWPVFASRASVDITVRTLVTVPGEGEVPVAGQGILRSANRIYVLANSGPEEEGSTLTDYQYPTLNLFEHFDFVGSWMRYDLLRGSNPLPGIAVNDGTSLGPNSMEIVPKHNGDALIYVVYSDALENDFTNNSRGLRVAYATENASGLSAWTSPAIAGLIDGRYSYVRNHPRNDLVDLRVKPDAKISENSFDRLGCAYITNDARLVLMETVGTGDTAQWEPVVVDNPENAIDLGAFRWVKLGYFDPDGPGSEPAHAWVLYSLWTGPDTADIRLWVQP